MELIIRLQSRFSNAFLFLIVDVIGLWSIHRCLKSLQAYYYYRLALSGRSVPIARSRIPVFSGELLHGVTNFGLVFVLGNTLAILIAFIATSEVNGETRPVLTPVIRSNVTTLFEKFGKWNDNSKFQSTVALCKTSNTTHFAYWPVAFNINETRRDAIWPIDSECQKELPGYKPLVMLECAKFGRKDCNIYERRPVYKLFADTIPGTEQNHSELVTEIQFNRTTIQPSDTDISFNELNGRAGHVFVFREPLPSHSHLRRAIALLPDLSNDRWYVSQGSVHNHTSSMIELGLSFPGILSPASVVSKDSNFLILLRQKTAFPRIEVDSGNLPILFLKLFNDLFGSDTLNTEAFSKEDKEVTVVSTKAIVLYALLTVVLLLLFFTKELIMFLVIRARNGVTSEVFATDFNELSKALRLAMEREQDMQFSGSYAQLTAQVDQRGMTRVSTTGGFVSYKHLS